MAALSTMRRTRNGGQRATANAPQNAPENAQTMERLLARVEELERQVVQQPAPRERSEMLPVGKPFKFDGTRDDQRVRLWLSEVETLHQAQERQVGPQRFRESDKVIIAESYLGETARRHYNQKVRKSGQFETYEALKGWMLKYYAPADLILKYRDVYNDLKQRDGEDVESYYLRFTEALSKLDDEPKETWQVSDFIRGLRPAAAKHLASFNDLDDFQGVTVEQVYQRLARSVRLATGPGHESDERGHKRHGNGEVSGGNGNSARNESGRKSGRKSSEQRVSSQSKQKFKHSGSGWSGPGGQGKVSKLTAEQKQSVAELIQRNGGELVDKAIRDSNEWFALAKEKNVCRNCAGRGHYAKDCPLKSSGRSGELNAILSSLQDLKKAVSLVNTNDIAYLCALAESTPLAMFPCSIDGGSFGIALLDDGAARNFVSLSYAKRARLRIQGFVEEPKPIHLPNGQVMKIYGTTEFDLEMSEWKGKVRAWVLDIQANFDIVLGMEWHREWEPIPNWKKLEFTVETKQGTKRIRRLPDTPDLQEIEDISDEVKQEFNLISVEELEKEVKGARVEFTLYFVRGRLEDDEVQLNTISDTTMQSELAEEDQELQDLLDEFRDVFREELPDGLPPKRDVDHVIDTGTEQPSNRNAYPLSVQQLQEEARQIEGLLKHQLIRESTSPWGAPVLFVRKPKTPGEWRMCIDYRALNNKTVRNAYPLPRIQDCIDKLGKAKHCTNWTLRLGIGRFELRIRKSQRQQGWQSSVCNSTDGRTDGRNFRPRLVSSHDFWDERYFVRLFGRLQVELKYDRCSL